MMAFDLILPYPPNQDNQIQVFEFGTWQTVWRDADNPYNGHGVMHWKEFAGYGLPNPFASHTTQPYVGCPTGGGIVADMIMQHLPY